MALNCLSGLVGLANRDCLCLSGGQPSGWNDSESGYYLDDREHGFPVKSSLYANVDCGESTIWDTLGEARTQGIRDVQNDLLQALSTVRESRVINWRGLIGKAEGTGSLVSSNTYSGIQLRPRIRMKDAYFMLKAVWIHIDETKSVNITVNSNDGTYTPTATSGNVTANQWSKVEFSSPISLPMYSINVGDLRYNVAYEPGGANVKQNRLWCCGKPPWMNHFDAGGFVEAALPGDDTLPTLSEAHGLALEGYFTCNKLDWICDLEEMNGLDLRDLIARLIQWKSSIHLITGVLRSDRVNRATMLDQEGLYRQRSHLQKMYENAVQWVSENLPGGVTACWGCEKAEPQIKSLVS